MEKKTENKEITKGVLFSKNYNEYYKSTTLGLSESFFKFVNPSFKYYFQKINKKKNKTKTTKNNNTKIINKNKNINIKILDDCFGYGFNTLATIIYFKINLTKEKTKNYKLKITSFEKYEKVITQLKNIEKELNQYLEETNYLNSFFPNTEKIFRKKTIEKSINILKSIKTNKTIKNLDIKTYEYKDKDIQIIINNTDLNNINKIQKLNKKLKIIPKKTKFDFIYHDPFSKKNNPDAWSKNLINKLNKYTKKTTLITSYSSNGEFRNDLRNLSYKILNIEAHGRRRPSTLAIKEKYYKLLNL